MTKNDLDDELNENLDFLEEHDVNVNENGGSLSTKQPFSFNKPNKKLLIIVGVVIGIIILTIIINKKKSHHMITNVPESPHHTAPEAHHPVAKPINNPATPPLQNQTTSNTPLNQNNVTWQELKQTVVTNTPPASLAPDNSAPLPPPSTTDQSPNTLNTNANTFEINLPVNGFEHQTTAQTNQIQANNNYRTQETISELKSAIETITNDLAATTNQIKELQNNLQEISRSISNVNSSTNNIDSRILNLTSTIDNLSMDVKNVKKYIQEEDLDLTANVKPSEQDLFSNTPEYVVHAVIPGRAWLKSSSGQIITVAEGDSFGDYGKIALIDAANNLVRTSSGVVFR